MKQTAEVAQQLSNACVKAMMAALALSALALGISERFADAPKFEAFAKFEIARETLGDQLRDLQSDPCWLRYTRSLGNRPDSVQTSLKGLGTIQCSDQGSVKVGSDVRVVPSDDPDSYVPPGLAVNPPELILHDQRVADDNPTPKRPMAPKIEIWGKLGLDTSSLETLWDDALLSTARSYSVVAAHEINVWQALRSRLEIKRRIPNDHSNLAARFSNLHIADLQDIAAQAHVGISNLDQIVRESFRASLPDTSLGVQIGTAARVVSIGLMLFTIALAAYVSAAVKLDALSAPGTVFSVWLGSPWFEVTGLLLIWLPAFSLVSLCLAAGWGSRRSYFLWTCAFIVVAATLFMLSRVTPHTALARLMGRSRRT